MFLPECSWQRARHFLTRLIITTQVFVIVGCSRPISSGPSERASHPQQLVDAQVPNPDVRDEWTDRRRQMVAEQLIARRIKNERVLKIMGRVPRHEFVPASVRGAAYEDTPLPIGQNQTISQPYIVALMTELADPQPNQRVLEIGTGSGYQAAVLAELAGEVYTIELLPDLAKQAKARLERLGYRRVHVRTGDGYLGWPTAAPFDSIVVTCGADHVPEPLFQQLKPGGTMVIPIGKYPGVQSLRLITKGPHGDQQARDVLPVRFVPFRRAGDVGGK
jgi:protein-L-isoaspartate(D-aspartate) O-methyltransferase